MTREEQINKVALERYSDVGDTWDEMQAFKRGAEWADLNPGLNWKGKLTVSDDDDEMKVVTDWNQVRIQAAIAAMKGIMSDVDSFTTNQSPNGVAKISVDFADSLVKELKGE